MAHVPDVNCSIAAALGEIGERWSLLIIREAVMGSSRFDEFHQNLGVARNILSDRLSALVRHGVLERTPSRESARIHHYRLTEKGRELLPVIAALMHWGDKWVNADIGAPVILVERATRQPIQKVAICSKDGLPLQRGDIEILPGPGATSEMRDRFAAVGKSEKIAGSAGSA